jgi:hypothetical protein
MGTWHLSADKPKQEQRRADPEEPTEHGQHERSRKPDKKKGYVYPHPAKSFTFSFLFVNKKKCLKDWGCSSVVEHLPSIYKAPGLISSTARKQNTKKL